jgi:ADP-ribose pyrophosphatase YjhB (NUDIX family)
MQEQVDWVYRLAYRLAYPIARRWWRLYGRHHGVSIAVWLGDTVLAVHHSYKPGLRLPGGGVGWREDHRQAAVRELREEVGVILDPAQLRLVASNPGGSSRLYEARVESLPELVIDRREITEARFVRPTLLYEMRYRSGVGAYLRHALAKRRMRPVCGMFHKTMLHRVEVRVVQVSRKVSIIADRVLPVPPLPNAAFATAGHGR